MAAGDEPQEMQKRVWPVVVSLFMPGAGHLAVGDYVRGSLIVLVFQGLGWALAAVCSFGHPWLACGLIFASVLSRIPICVDTRRRDGTHARPKLWSFVVALAALVAVSELSSSLRHELLAEAFKIPVDSMAPTLLSGDHVNVTKLDFTPERGGLVAHAMAGDGGIQIKRVVGVAGDTVAVTAEGLFVNGKPTRIGDPLGPCAPPVNDCQLIAERLGDRAYTAAVSRSPSSPREWSVTDGHVFVVGDNRENSFDSRHVGPVALDAIVGKPNFVWWSSSPNGLRWSRTLESIQ